MRLLIITLFLSFSGLSRAQSSYGPIPVGAGNYRNNGDLKLVWSDEFDNTGKPDPTKWRCEYGFIRNREAQYYTDRLENVRTENGLLIIETRKEDHRNSAFKSEEHKDWRISREFARYTSASLSTKNLAAWTYGKIEVKAKLPGGVGLWPAIWMLGANRDSVGWPQCGEIDIMEHVGFNPDSVFGTIHTEAYNHMRGTQKGKKVFIQNPYDEFHTYSIIWTPEKIDFLLDGESYHRIVNEHKTTAEWPFDQPFYLKLNVAVGGALGGKKGIDDSIFPQKMEIDFVRIYQQE